MSDAPSPDPTPAAPRLGRASLHVSLVEAEGIVVELVESKVFLRGHVRSLAEREEAERRARQAPGVTAVENHVVVLPDGDGPEVSR